MYAILRTKRIHKDELLKAIGHNLRKKGFCGRYVNKDKSHENKTLVDVLGFGSAGEEVEKKVCDYYKGIEARSRKDSVYMMEFVLTASPDFFKKSDKKKIEKWIDEQVSFLKVKFGDKLKHVVLHKDEGSIHLHALITCEEKKIHTFKNRHGESKKEVVSLNADRFNKKYLVDLQTEYAEFNKKFGLKRGVRRSDQKHESVKKFWADVEELSKLDFETRINELIDEIPALLGVCKKEDIKKHLTPVLNEFVKAAKAIKHKKNADLSIEELNKKIEEYEIKLKHQCELEENRKALERLYKSAKVELAEIKNHIADLKNQVFDLKEENKILAEKMKKLEQPTQAIDKKLKIS